MKYHVTQKYIRAVYGDCLYSLGYCNAQHLLIGVSPFAYNSGVYGWNCDYYLIGDICLSTGYRPHGAKIYDKTKTFEARAEAIYNDYTIDYTERMQKIEVIRNEWFNTLTEV